MKDEKYSVSKGRIDLQQRTMSTVQILGNPIILLKCAKRGAKWFVLLTQYCAGDKIEKNKMGWACGAYGWGEGLYRVLVGKLEGKRPLGRPRRRWGDNIMMDLQEVDCGYMDWIGLAQDRGRWRKLVSAVMNLRIPWNAGNLLTSCKPVSFSRGTLNHGVSKLVSYSLLIKAFLVRA